MFFKAVAPGRSTMFQWVPPARSIWISQIIVDGLLNFLKGGMKLERYRGSGRGGR